MIYEVFCTERRSTHVTDGMRLLVELCMQKHAEGWEILSHAFVLTGGDAYYDQRGYYTILCRKPS